MENKEPFPIKHLSILLFDSLHRGLDGQVYLPEEIAIYIANTLDPQEEHFHIEHTSDAPLMECWPIYKWHESVKRYEQRKIESEAYNRILFLKKEALVGLTKAIVEHTSMEEADAGILGLRLLDKKLIQQIRFFGFDIDNEKWKDLV